MNSRLQITPSKPQRASSSHQSQLSETQSEINNSYLTYQPHSLSPKHKAYVNNPSIYSTSSEKFNSPLYNHQKWLQNQCSRVKKGQKTNYNYQAIEQILKKQNYNLQQQNNLLLNEVQRLRTNNKKYKSISQNQSNEIECLRQQCSAHKKYADQMKDQIMLHLKQLETKALEQNDSQSEQSLVIITGISLNQSSSIRQD